VLIIDSSSSDGTLEVAESLGATTIVIERASFDHGGTRNMAADASSGDVLVFLTQDALPRDNMLIENLTGPLHDPNVALSYGRQLPRPDAGALDRFLRAFRYAERPKITDEKMLKQFGIKAISNSNVCSAVKRSCFIEVGRFPEPSIVGEDVTLAAKLLLKGYKIAYTPSAEVYHSHNYSLRQQFGRYFDIGVFFSRQKWILEQAVPDREGYRFIKEQISFLIRERIARLIPYAILEAAAKFAAYRLGLWERHLPAAVKRRISMHSFFWDRP
jgi:rhamnosyltransferase